MTSAAALIAELAADPAKASLVPPDEARSLYAMCALVQAALLPFLMASGVVGVPAADRGERAVGIEEAARILGMKKDGLYRKWRVLGCAYRDVDGRIKFSLDGLRRYIARRAGKPS